jgi:hypothetical protein
MATWGDEFSKSCNCTLRPEDCCARYVQVPEWNLWPPTQAVTVSSHTDIAPWLVITIEDPARRNRGKRRYRRVEKEKSR